MDVLTHTYFLNLNSEDWELQYEAYQKILKVTKKQVDWTYEVWDDIVMDLKNHNPHIRSRSAQFLAHLAISDPKKKIMDDFPKLWEVTTRDPKFSTKRHCLQSIWRIGLAGAEQRELLLNHLTNRFKVCEGEKNYMLVRSDILQGMRNLYDHRQCHELKETAHHLIELETDSKYKEKFKEIWSVT